MSSFNHKNTKTIKHKNTQKILLLTSFLGHVKVKTNKINITTIKKPNKEAVMKVQRSIFSFLFLSVLFLVILVNCASTHVNKTPVQISDRGIIIITSKPYFYVNEIKVGMRYSEACNFFLDVIKWSYSRERDCWYPPNKRMAISFSVKNNSIRKIFIRRHTKRGVVSTLIQ